MKEFAIAFRKAGMTGVIDLDTGDRQTVPVLVQEVQRDPVSNRVLHVSFHTVDLTKPTTASVPLQFIGEAPAVKNKGGVLVPHLNHVEVEALPDDIPDHIEVDLSALAEINDAVHVQQLALPQGVKVRSHADELVVRVEPPRVTEGLAPAPAPGEAAEAAKEGAGAGTQA